ncbi:MAG TPA: CGNR zinc finger domain-containing protein [Jatrophihabitans sp.]|nr:CGNR zinc finger domain-containing protein [Jatrophihabitans sp.]
MSTARRHGQPTSLDFIATYLSRGLLEIETVRAGADLVEWVRRAGIVHDLTKVDAAELTRTRELREALHAGVCWAVEGHPLRTWELTAINDAAAGATPRLRLGPREVHRSGGLPAVLGHLAHDLLDLLGSPDHTRLRWCGSVECRRPVLDRSHDGRRRWCGKACRDRASALGYRERAFSRRSAAVSA